MSVAPEASFRDSTTLFARTQSACPVVQTIIGAEIEQCIYFVNIY